MKKNDKYYEVSKFWLDIEKYQSDSEILKLVTIQKIINNFIKIITNQDIPAHFSEKTGPSFTDKKEIIISAEPDKLDKIIGLALHEASHVFETDFEIYDNSKMVKYNDLLKKYSDNTKLFFKDLFELKNYIHLFYNFVEDLRIDTNTINNNPGYKGYVEIRYNDFFESKDNIKLIKSKEFRDETWESYKFRVINIINPVANLKALKGLEEINEILAVDNISRLKNSGDSLNLAVDIFSIIEKYCNKIKEEKENRSKSYSNKNSKLIKDQENTIVHKIQKKKLNKQTVSKVNSLVNIKLEQKLIKLPNEENYSHEFKVLIIKQINNQFILDDPFEIFLYKYNNANEKEIIIKEGLALGEKLASKLIIRNIEKNEICSFKQRGKLDSRLLHTIPFNDKIYYTSIQEKFNDIYLRFSLDGSGSMRGKKWNRTAKTVLAICSACLKLTGIRIVVDFRVTGTVNDEFTPIEMIVFDSAKESINKLIFVFNRFNSGSGTPEGLCFNSIINDIEETNENKESIFINFSDGMPAFLDYKGKLAAEHTKKIVAKIRRKGVKIQSYFISGSEMGFDKYLFTEMYGKDAIFCNIEELNTLAESLNKLFTKGF